MLKLQLHVSQEEEGRRPVDQTLILKDASDYINFNAWRKIDCLVSLYLQQKLLYWLFFVSKCERRNPSIDNPIHG